MKKLLFAPLMIFLISTAAFGQEDAEGTKDNPMFPTRMPNYFITEVVNNYNAVEFSMVKGGETMVTKEGETSTVRYDFNAEGKSKPSVLQILRNYENAAKKIGGTTVMMDLMQGQATFQINKNGKEAVWVKVECGGDGGNAFYELTIVQLAEMKQEITSDDILTALNNDGHIALYINFENGKSDIKPESQIIMEQISEMLKANPDVKISIEGHTDNVGSAPSNQILSQNRAKSVSNDLMQKGIDKTRLSSKGWGQTKPVDDNNTEEGKAKNRRVEIVKL